MASMDSIGDQTEGRGEQVKGKLKEMAGQTFNDPALAAEGEGEQAKGKLTEAKGDAKGAVDKAKEGVKDLFE
ncbi:MAG: CsbD family protein [Actinomycetota bacterium]|nr:CsbD family protein [Actinomycetota bacterium]